MESSFTLFRVRGIPIGINWSWLIIFTLIVYSLGAGLFPRTYPGLEGSTYMAMGVVAGIIFFLSILLHELGHAFRALREGMEIDGITLWLFGGVARFKGMFPTAGAEFRIAIAGPIVTVLLAAGFLGARWALAEAGASEAAVGVADYLWRINGLLLAFNMVPALPLDGGRVLRSYLWHRRGNFTAATMSATRAARAFAGGLIAFGVLGFITGAALGGLWFAFIGWFLLQAAQAEASFALFRQAMRGMRVRDLMTPDPAVVESARTISSFIDEVAHARGHSTYPVLDGGRLAGLMSLRRAARVPGAERMTTTVRDVMLPAEEAVVVGPEAEIIEVVPALQQDPGRAVVVSDGRVVGIISTSDIGRAIELEQIRSPGAAEGPRRRGGLPAVLGVVLAVVLAVGWLYRLPVVTINPGEAFDVTGDIRIEGVETDEVDGSYLLTSVALDQPNGFGFLVAIFTGRDIRPIRAVIPEGVDPREYFDQQVELFSQTQMVAAAAAARAAGMEVQLSGSGASVVGVIPGSPAADALREGDVIVAVNGTTVELATDLGRAIRSRPAGAMFELSVERDGETLPVEVRSRTGVIENDPGIGVVVETRDLETTLPFDISFEPREIGGPSAGISYALAVYDLLDPGNLAAGRAVASTGLIDLEGRVGQVGGLSEKAEAARRAGADVFLVPAEEIRGVTGNGMEVRGVSTLADAIEVLS